MGKFKDFFSKKRKVVKLVSYCFSSFLFLGIVGAAVGTGYVAKKDFEEGSDFSKSYNLRYELDLENTENPNESEPAPSEEDVKKALDQAVVAYSKYLNDEQLYTSNIYPEISKDNNGDLHAFINVTVQNQKIEDPRPSAEKDAPKIDKNPVEIYFDSIYSSRLSVFYHPDSNNGKDYILTKEDLVNNDKSFYLPANTYENSLFINVDSRAANEKNGIKEIKETFKNAADSKDDVKPQPYLYVINDQQGFLNRLNYILKVALITKQYPNNEYYSNIYNYYFSDDEREFAKDYIEFYHYDTGVPQLKSIIPDLDVCNGEAAYDDTGTTLAALHCGSIFSDNNIYIDKHHNFIEGIEDDLDKPLVHTGNLKYSFMKKWIVAILANGSSDSSDDYTKFFPDKNPIKNTQDSDDKWIVLTSPTTSRFDTELLKKEFTTYSFPYPVKDVTYDNFNGDWYELLTGIAGDGVQYNKPTNINEISISLFNNIMGNTPLMSTLIVLIVVSLLVGIIVSLLYKVPGLYAFGTTSFTTILTMFLLFLGGHQFTVSLAMGLIIVLALGAFSVINLFERLKKQIGMTYDMQTSTKRAFMSAIMPCIDLHIIVLLLGIVLTYFGPSILISAGIVLIIGSLLSFAFNFVFMWIILWINFGNSANEKDFNVFVWKRNKLVAKLEKKSEQNANLNKMTFFGNQIIENKSKGSKLLNKCFGKTEIFTWKSAIYWGISLLVAIVGITLLFTIGVHPSYSFYGGTRLVIWYSGDTFDLNNFKTLINEHASWYNISVEGNYVYAYTSQSFAYSEVMTWGLPYDTIRVETVSNSTIMNFVHKDVNLLLITTAFICLYAFIRLGWTSVIGIFIGTVLPLLLTLSFVTIFQIYFDTYIVYAAIFAFAINAMLVFNVQANINNTWFKEKATDWVSIKKIVNGQINCSLQYFVVVGSISLISIFASILCSSVTLTSFNYLILIAFAISIFSSMFFAPYVTSFFVWIKNKYLVNITSKALLSKNYDIIDEEVIDGINKVNKEKVYL